MDLDILKQPTPAERIKLLQAEAEAEAHHLFDDFGDRLTKLQQMAREIEGLGNSFSHLAATAKELVPQIDRWATIVAGVQAKRGR